jgi:hypothetical protein
MAFLDCTCGKKLRVPDEHAGKSVRCPSCNAVLTVPAAAPSAPTPPPVPPFPPAESPSGMVRFACACGKPMQARAEYGGRSTNCPACGAAVLIPRGGSAAVQPASALAGVQPPPPPPAPPGPLPPKSRRKTPLWPFLVGGGAVLAIVVVVVLFLVFGSGSAPDLNYVPGNAQGFVSVRVADLWKSEGFQRLLKKHGGGDPADEIEEEIGLSPHDIERFTLVVDDAQMEKGWAVVLLNKAVEEKKLLEKFEELHGKAKEDRAGGKAYYAFGDGGVVHFAGGRVLIFAPNAAAMQACLDRAGSSGKGPLAGAIRQAAGRDHFVAALNPPPELKAMGAMMPEGQALFRLDSAVLSANLGGGDAEVEVRVAYGSDGDARDARETLERLRRDVEGRQMLRQARIDDRDLDVEQRGREVRLRLKAPADNDAFNLMQAIDRLRDSASGGSTKNLHQLAIAMLNYHDANGCMPPAVKRDPNGRPLWSWRVELLPYLEEGAIWQQLNQLEPWDGPNNRRVLATMPRVFAMPNRPAGNKTYYQVFVGRGAPFSNEPAFRQGPRLTDIRDGTSNTIMIAEAATAVDWAAPGDLSFDENQPFDPQVLGGGPGKSFRVAMFDGSVRRVKRSAKPQSLKLAIMPNDGNVLPDNWAD